MSYIDGWMWDDGNIGHLARHGLTPKIVLEVAHKGPKFRENVEGRAASIQMIGPDESLATWTVCIVESTEHPGMWRAITGWPATDAEREWYWEVTQ